MHPYTKKKPPQVHRLLLATCTCLTGVSGYSQSAFALDQALNSWEVGAVLDVAHTSRSLALGQREQGLALGHSDVFGRGPLGRHLESQVSLAAHSQDGQVEFELEEAWLQTKTLPAGLEARAGRFSSQIGYLNEQHPHADDFVERPLLYRAFLGGHWFDDGIRLNWTAPTQAYVRLGAEVLRGRQLVPEATPIQRPGAITLSAKIGGDLNASHSWQWGLSHLHNRLEAGLEADHSEEEAHGHEDAHAHAHGARYVGQRLSMLDFTWKWSPHGNNQKEQVRVSAEWARVTDLGGAFNASDRHEAGTLAVVWRLASAWELGARTDWLRVRMVHDEAVEAGRLNEHALMLAWKPTHAQSLRLQYTQQGRVLNLENAARRSIQLQYVLALGAHGAHAF